MDIPFQILITVLELHHYKHTFEDIRFAIDQQRLLPLIYCDTFQWEISTDGGINWAALSDDTTYSGVNSTTY